MMLGVIAGIVLIHSFWRINHGGRSHSSWWTREERDADDRGA